MNLLDSRTEKGQSIYLMGLKFEARSIEVAEHVFQYVGETIQVGNPRGLNCFVPLRGVGSKIFLEFNIISYTM